MENELILDEYDSLIIVSALLQLSLHKAQSCSFNPTGRAKILQFAILDYITTNFASHKFYHVITVPITNSYLNNIKILAEICEETLRLIP